jgi:hypothetical protein
MDPLYKPLTGEQKQKLQERGLKEWEYFRFNKWADPDSAYCIHNINIR